MERLTEMIGDFVVLKKCAETRCVEICDECGVDKEAKKKLKEYEDAEEQGLLYGKWIPCRERLPENDENVLVWFEYFRYGEYNRLFRTTGISHTFHGEWLGFVNGSSGWSKLRIIAWMPLPEPYKEE